MSERQTRSADAGLPESAVPVSPDEADREAAAGEALKRAQLPADLLQRTKADPGAPFEHAETFATMRDKSPADWARVKVALKAAGVTLGDLERAMGAGASGDGKAGQPVRWDDPEPWSERVDGVGLLDDIKRLVEHYASLPNGGAAAVALWALYTWTFESFSVCPNLLVTAPERESGKTRVTELLSWMVHRPKPVSDASAAAIIRGIERDGPTLLFDEAQSFLKRKSNDPVRGILLASFSKRFAFVERCEGDSNEPRAFSTFAPKVMNGRDLASLDDMLTSRSIVLPMTRATCRLPELRDDRDPVGLDVRRQCARWAADNAVALREADPDVGERMGRPAQVWRPLFAIADAAGGDWPALARSAADALSASAATVANGETLGTMLLADVREVFKAKGDPERIASATLDEALRSLSERPWQSMPKSGKPITAQSRGRILANYGIHAKTLRLDAGRDAKGYERAAFADAWAAYLPDDDGSGTVEPLTCRESRYFRDSRTVDTGTAVNGSDHTEIAVKQGRSTAQRFENRGAQGNGADSAPALVPLPLQLPGTERAGDTYRKARDGE